MPIAWLSPFDIQFPDVAEANSDGILAVGGDLSPNRLLSAYWRGIFPWYLDDEPILWWFPNPRMVLMPTDLKVARSMRPLFNQQKFRVSVNRDFKSVMKNCRKIDRKNQDGTWINDQIEQSYGILHSWGFAHSCEVWDENDVLVGGFYGVSLGNIFYGESMFAHVPNASKFGFIAFVQEIARLGIVLVDCQQETVHLASLGAQPISSKIFQDFLIKSEAQPHILQAAFHKKITWLQGKSTK